MSFRSGIFNSTAADLTPEGYVRGNKAVDASFFANIFSSLFTNGVFLTNDGGGFHTTPVIENIGEGIPLTVKMSGGACHIGGYFGFDDAETTHTFPQSATDTTYVHRLRLDLTTGEITSTWVACRDNGNAFITLEGDEALPKRTEMIYDLLTARVDLAAGTPYISYSDITDLRTNASYCGVVAGAVTSVDTEAWSTQMQAYVTALREATEALPAGDIAALAMGKLSDDMKNLAESPNASAMQRLAGAHTHTAAQLSEGTLQSGVKAATGTDFGTFRLRNIAFGETLPENGAGIAEGDIWGVCG